MTSHPTDTEQILPAHIEQTIQAIAKLRADHDQRATASETLLRSAVAKVASPRSLSIVLLLVAGWMVANFIAIALGYPALDEPPYFGLDTILAVTSLCVTLTILTIQRRDDGLSALREQLALELAVLGEQKNAKIIELLENLRRDHPAVPDRQDPEAAAMAKPADPREVIEAIEEAHAVEVGDASEAAKRSETGS